MKETIVLDLRYHLQLVLGGQLVSGSKLTIVSHGLVVFTNLESEPLNVHLAVRAVLTLGGGVRGTDMVSDAPLTSS